MIPVSLLPDLKRVLSSLLLASDEGIIAALYEDLGKIFDKAKAEAKSGIVEVDTMASMETTYYARRTSGIWAEWPVGQCSDTATIESWTKPT